MEKRSLRGSLILATLDILIPSPYLDPITMPPKKRITFHITDDQKRGLEALKRRDGIPEGEAVRRAIDAFLVAKGIDVTHESEQAVRRRGSTRRRT